MDFHSSDPGQQSKALKFGTIGFGIVQRYFSGA
jgi:hypothetical protein